MATQPDAPPDTIEPQSPPEVDPVPDDPSPSYPPDETPYLPPDFDQPDVSPQEAPPLIA
jgi:hypothetical protein